MTLESRLERLLERVQRAAEKVGKSVSDITLIAVTKYATKEQMQEAYSLGIRHFGESRLAIALEKKPFFQKDVNWHFIGPIQSNKAIKIASSFSFIHSIDSIKIAEKISAFGQDKQSKIPCFIELNLAKEETKHGFLKEEFLQVQKHLFSLNGLDIQGLMTMAPHKAGDKNIRACFRLAAEMSYNLPYTARSLSMGMSDDFEIAIEEGATHIRIGSLLFQS